MKRWPGSGLRSGLPALVAALVCGSCGGTGAAESDPPGGSHAGSPDGGTQPEDDGGGPTAPAVSSPTEPGPYRVGVRRFDLPPDAHGRALPVEVWYPASPDDGAPVAQYELMLGPLVLSTIDSPLAAVRDAAIDPRGGPYPTVVFSHGFGGVRFQNLYLTEYLATHGFVVAAPDHVGNTLSEQVNDAEALPAAEAARLRPLDVSATLDALLARSADGAHPLSGACDPARVGVAGHSFGGYTAFRIAGAEIDPDTACQGSDEPFCEGWDGRFPVSARDDRFRAALAQAPGGAAVFQDGFGSVAVPMLIEAGDLDQTTPLQEEAAPAFAKLASDATLVVLEGAGHFTFTDLCGWLEQMGLTLEQFDDGCSAANVDPAEAHPLIVRYATAFMQVEVQGDSSFAGVLDPSRLPPGVASLETK